MPISRVSTYFILSKPGLHTQIFDASSLYSTRVPRGTLRIGLVSILFRDLAIITRVRVDHHTQHA